MISLLVLSSTLLLPTLLSRRIGLSEDISNTDCNY